MARRKNATFTLDRRTGDRTLIQAFYAELNRLYPGATPIPIPPESHVNPKHDVKTQKYIFADLAVLKIAPIALRVAGLEDLAAKFKKLDPITDEKTAYKAYTFVRDDVVRTTANKADSARYFAHKAEGDAYRAARAAREAAYGAHYAVQNAADAAKAEAGYAFDANAADAVTSAARAAYQAAESNPEATWEAVHEMLQAL